MKKAVAALMAVCIIGGFVPLVQAVTQSDEVRTGKLWEAQVVPCSLELCGGFPANVATLSLQRGIVTVKQNGQVVIELKQVRWLGTQGLAANKTFQVHLGTFTHLVFEGRSLGTITTDSKGNYLGTINANGVPFAFPAGTVISGEFIFNDPNVRTEFITGFKVPSKFEIKPE